MSAADHHHELTGRRLRLALLLTVGIMLLELAGAAASHSVALLADAGHILMDALSLGLAWAAARAAARPADDSRTYGYQRVGILAAMANGAMLIVVTLLVAAAAVGRLQHPEPVAGGLVAATALAAIALNAFIGLSLRHHASNLNVRAALTHVVGDLAADAGVVVAGVVTLATGWLYADPLVSLLIAPLIAAGAVRIVLDTSQVLLEGTPGSIRVADVRQAMLETPGVESVHDLHVWSLAAEQVAVSSHLVVSEQGMAEVEHIVRAVEERLCRDFDIGHTTLQAELCHPCEAESDHAVGEHNHPHPAQPAHTH